MKKENQFMYAQIVIILLLILIILILLFGREKSFTITFNSNGGTEISSVEVKDGEIVTLPEFPTKEGFTFVGWTNEEGNVVTKGTKVTKDITLNAEWISNDAKTFNLKFDTNGGDEINDILVEEGKDILLPINPTKEDYIFVGWVNEEGNIITKDMLVNESITLKALWISADAKTVTVSFDTNGGNEIGSIVIENGKVILLPINPIKTGYVFSGWVDENGNEITKDSIVDKNITIKATWKEPYTCPSGCTPTGDGSKCTKVSTKEMINVSTCPSGYTLKNNQCLDVKNKYHANSIDISPFWACNSSSEVMYSEVDSSGLGAFMWCANKANKVTTKGCPSGYKKDGSKCIKIETIKCTAN